ncbi:lipid-binding SYLF domain-containing protein [Francisellaceae bacterium]|nr:lipid-binding SYLF domain-containing protein [Francisellaceae bacterium]
MSNMRYKSFSAIVLLSASMIANADVNESAVQSTIKTFKDNAQIAPFFENAYAYAVYPNITKGGIIVGFGEGEGVVYKQGDKVGTSEVTAFSIGAQLGAQTYSQVIFLENKEAYTNFLAQGTVLDLNASAAFITLGANAQVGTGGVSSSASTGEMAANTNPKINGNYTNSIATFVLTKAGLMGQATIGGQTFEFKSND